MQRSKSRRNCYLAASALMLVCVGVGATSAVGGKPYGDPSPYRAAKETPLSMVNALHTAFGDHHDRAVHTKGIVLEGDFTPDASARTLTKLPILAGGTVPVIARFSLFAGVPDLPDNDDGASPAGLAIKLISANGEDFDIEANQHNSFIVRTFDEFAIFLRALGAAHAGNSQALDAFLAAHPEAKEFLSTRTYPATYSSAKYFGVNSVKLINASGKVSYARYRFVPRDPERYLTPEERKAKDGAYLQTEVVKRVATSPILFDLYAQIAEPQDKVEDPSIAWPESRRLVRLGVLRLTRQPADPKEAARTLLFLPGQTHPGVEPADPMLILRNAAYPISLGQRQ